MLDIDFDDGMINKLAEIICGDDYHEKFCEDITLTKCPVYRTTGQLYEFFQDLLEIEDEGYSRLPFTIDCLKKLNNLNRMDEVLIKLTNPKAYLDEKITVISDTSQTLGSSFLLSKGEERSFVIIIWIPNFEEDQNEYDGGGSFTAEVTYESTSEYRLTGSISSN